MNFNASGGRHPSKLGAKRIEKQNVDLSMPHPGFQPPFNPYVPSSAEPINQNPNLPFGYNNMSPQGTYNLNMQFGAPQQQLSSQSNLGFAVPNQYLSEPLVNAAAMTYGHFVGSGKNYVDKEIEKYVPVSRLKYYFAVDTAYVYKKLGLIFFPFAHKDWSVKYAAHEPVQPRYEVNAPDLYIPTMAYLTYVLVAGLALGTQNRFTPEVLGIQASSALAWTILEIVVHLLSLYIAAISTSLSTIDILAFSGYKFVGIIFAVLSSLIFYKLGYYIALIYFSISLSFFCMVMNDVYSMQQQHQQHHHIGEKRRFYLLLFIAGVQPFLMWWLSYHLVPSLTPKTS